MPKYEIRFNVHSVGSDPKSFSGHANVSFVVDGVVQFTIGGQVKSNAGVKGIINGSSGPMDGVMKIEELDATNGYIYESVPVTSTQYNHILNYAKGLIGDEYNYGLFSKNCVDFAQHIYELTNHPGHFGGLFSGSQRGQSPVWFSIPYSGDSRGPQKPGLPPPAGYTDPVYNPKVPVPWNGIPAIEAFATDDRLCFAAGTSITLWDGTAKSIEDISVGDAVLSFDEGGHLVSGRVSRLLANVTDTWLSVSAKDGCALGADKGVGEGRMVVTSGHRFLRPDGSFEEIAKIIADDGPLGGQIVDAEGKVVAVTAEVLRYSAETAHLFEEGRQQITASSDATALAPEIKHGWRTHDALSELIFISAAGRTGVWGVCVNGTSDLEQAA